MNTRTQARARRVLAQMADLPTIDRRALIERVHTRLPGDRLRLRAALHARRAARSRTTKTDA